MIVYNNQVFSEDPIYRFHFEEFEIPENFYLHVGYNPSNLKKTNKDEKHILIDLEQPNRFLHPSTNYSTTDCENFYDKILTINPEFVKNRNKKLNKNLYQHVFFPFSEKYLNFNFDKTNEIIYTGNVDYFGLNQKFSKYSYIWVGNGGTHRNIDYISKINLTNISKISLSHSIVDFNNLTDYLNTHLDTVTHNNGVFEQHKARTIEAAFSKCIIIHLKTGQNIIEEFFKEGEDFLYYEDGIIDEVLENYNKYEYLANNAFNKAINNYSTKEFYKQYIKPLI
jgi:hypothetical protein